MIIGLLSDSHDHLQPLKEALAILQGAGAQFYVHCGDVGGEEILDAMSGMSVAMVWGNTDWDRASLTRYAQDLHLQVLGNFGELTLAGKRIAVTHGDEPMYIRQVMQQNHHDYLFTGHTHIAKDERIGNLRWINPGALHRARPRTCAALNLLTDELTRFELAS